MVGKTESRLESLKALLDDAHRSMGLEFGFRLWDGVGVPADWPDDALAIRIADEGAVASLIRAPRLPTLANLWAAKRLDVVNGDLFDLVAKRPKGRAGDLRKRVGKLAALRTALAFLFVPRGGPWPLEAILQDRESSGAEAENKRNIAYHYDLSNAFYRLWLDEEMVYTCAYFHRWDDSLDVAQAQKLDMICRKLRLQPGQTMLDIGSGWGALACHAARHYGVAVTGVTLSEQQFAYARDKVQRLGLADKVTFEFKDYMLLEGRERFDRISSVGMF
jgi:cyclopropane-fatty-acyl-phospholipid synthase